MKYYIKCLTIQPIIFITLRGSSSLNTHGISKRVIYSESVSKMLQHGIENSNFSDTPSGSYKFNQTLRGSSLLNIDGVSKSVIF